MVMTRAKEVDVYSVTLHLSRCLIIPVVSYPLGIFRRGDKQWKALAVGVLARYITVWKLTLAGSVAGSISVSACYFANGIPYLIVFLGISQGISIAFMSLTHTVINQNFSRYKAVASGISAAGFTIASLTFPPLMQFFFDRYGIRGGFLLGGALMLNAAAGALLQRDSRAVSVPTPGGRAPDAPHEEKIHPEDSHKNSSSRVAEELSAELLPMSQQTLSKDHQSIEDENKNAFFSPRIAEKRGAYQLSAQKTELITLPVQAVLDAASRTELPPKLVPKSILQNRMIELLSFLAFPKFYIIAFSFSQLILSATIYLTVIVDFAMDRDISKWNSVLLITFYAAADMTSRLVSGLITDKGFLTRSSMMTLHFLLSATSLYLIPLCSSYSLNVLMSIILGWCNGANIILIPVFFMDLVDASKFSVCYGTATFLAGFPLLCRPMLIGYFRDTLGDYRGLFWLLGTLSACNVVFWSWLDVRERRQRR